MKNFKFLKDNIASIPEDFYSSETDLSPLITLPVHIMEEIVSYVDRFDKKSLSLCCTHLNGVLKQLKYLREMDFSLDMKKPSGLGAIFKAFPSSAVTKLHVTKNVKDVNFDISKFLKTLKYFGENLTYLNLDFRHKFSKIELLKRWNPLKRLKLIKLNKLTHLKISYEIFVFLSDVYIDFDSMTKLQYIAFVDNKTSAAEEEQFLIANSNGDRQFKHISQIRKFLIVQTELKELSFMGGHIAKMFDEPLNVKFMLEEFSMYRGPDDGKTKVDPSNSSHVLNDIQQNHLCDFVTSQIIELKILKVLFFVSDRTPESDYLMQKELEKQSICKNICISEDPQFLWLYFDSHYAVEFLEILDGFQPNTTTKDLSMQIIRNHPNEDIMKLIIFLVVQKFPNLNSLDLTLIDSESERFKINFLRNLKSLKRLKFNSTNSKCFNNVIIPSLEVLAFFICENNLKSIKKFLSHHNQIRELSIDISLKSDYVTLLENFFASALQNMNKLKLMTLCFSFGRDCKIESIDKLKFNFVHRMIVAVIREFAVKGFVLNSNIDGFVYMKRFDDKVVMIPPKSNCWQVVDFLFSPF